jgi:hypothetical protein
MAAIARLTIAVRSLEVLRMTLHRAVPDQFAGSHIRRRHWRLVQAAQGLIDPNAAPVLLSREERS